MDFALTDDQLSIQSIARDFAQKRIAPVAEKFDQSGEFRTVALAWTPSAMWWR